jgi:dephospho-CoA kinase
VSSSAAPSRSRRVGLTGGIGAGKSAVAARLAALGAVVVDADAIAREVLGPGTPGLARVAERFGPAVMGDDDTLNRPALARLVFTDAAAREALERIVHPLVRAETERRFAQAPPGRIVVHDVPLLVEAGLAAGYEAVIVVEASVPTRLARLVRDRGMTEAEVRDRMANQADDARRRAVATHLIDNNGSAADLDAAVARVWAALRR